MSCLKAGKVMKGRIPTPLVMPDNNTLSIGYVFGLDCTKKQHAKFVRDRRQNMFVCRGEVVEGW